MTNLSHVISKHLEHIQEEQKQLQRRYAQFPEGKLLVARDRKWEKWYNSIDGKRISISKENVTLAKALAQKRFMGAQLEELLRDEKACQAYLRRMKPPLATDQYVAEDSPFYPLLFQNSQKDAISEWYQSDFIRNPLYAEKCIHKSSSGNLLRSKSEAFIDEMLFRNGIPFHYEEQLLLNDHGVVYPDFKTYSFKRACFLYWEHYGLMDDPEYSAKAQRKTERYIRNGIIPQQNLIITMETKEHPLDFEYVNMLIQYYFLE